MSRVLLYLGSNLRGIEVTCYGQPLTAGGLKANPIHHLICGSASASTLTLFKPSPWACVHILNLEEQHPPTRMLLPLLILAGGRGAWHPTVVGMLHIHLRTIDFSKWGSRGRQRQKCWKHHAPGSNGLYSPTVRFGFFVSFLFPLAPPSQPR